MIVIISSSAREASALSVLATVGGRATRVCDSVRELKTLVDKAPPSVVLTRRDLKDGYSDDVLALLGDRGLLPEKTAVIVLASADCTTRQEARLLSLGASCVLRDPLRSDVLVEYIAKFLRPAPSTRAAAATSFELAGVTLWPDRRRAQVGKKQVQLSPKEMALARLLAESPRQVLTYEVLYNELFGRQFSGDSSNTRVLLGKLVRSFRRLRVDLRSRVQVTPKAGYRYMPMAPTAPHL